MSGATAPRSSLVFPATLLFRHAVALFSAKIGLLRRAKGVSGRKPHFFAAQKECFSGDITFSSRSSSVFGKNQAFSPRSRRIFPATSLFRRAVAWILAEKSFCAVREESFWRNKISEVFGSYVGEKIMLLKCSEGVFLKKRRF